MILGILYEFNLTDADLWNEVETEASLHPSGLLLQSFGVLYALIIAKYLRK